MKCRLLYHYLVMSLIWAVAGFALGVVGACVYGCGCKNAMPQIVQTQSLIDEGQSALDQARLVLEVANLPAEARSKVEAAMQRAYAALRAASAVLQGAFDACQFDVAAALAEFSEAWKIIRTFLPGLGESAAGAGSPVVTDPVIYSLYPPRS